MKKMIAAVLMAVATAVSAQFVVSWTLVGTAINIDGTVTCTYRVRMSDGSSSLTTLIAPGPMCPSQPGSGF